ncbi:Pyridoxal 5'-phosphate synthase subunit PdxT [subsurface metagenome]
MRIGVLALQGAFIEHIKLVKKLGTEALAVRRPDELKSLDGLIIPGGESTTILNLIHSFRLLKPIKKLAQAGFPILGTCAGMVCLAKKISNNSSLEALAVMDMAVRRNAFGRQIDSFEVQLPIPALGDKPFPAVFIRAPIIESAGPPVEILAKLPSGTIVAARQGRLLATAFHPELSNDLRLHRYFLDIIADAS